MLEKEGRLRAVTKWYEIQAVWQRTNAKRLGVLCFSTPTDSIREAEDE